VIANQRRSRRRRIALDERLAREAETAPREQASPDVDESRVQEALRSLRPKEREVLLLAEWEGLTPAQIAAVLGCLPVTARGRLHRARRRFRAAFEDLAIEGGRSRWMTASKLCEQPTRAQAQPTQSQ
jgi:RNA polymerase sigma factor (sigma-70 family)